MDLRRLLERGGETEVAEGEAEVGDSLEVEGERSWSPQILCATGTLLDAATYCPIMMTLQTHTCPNGFDVVSKFCFFLYAR